MSYIVTSGLLVLIEGDVKGQWFTAEEWQYTNFLGVIDLGTMKTMGGYQCPTVEKTKPFIYNNFKYRFHIHNHWNPCFIENMTTKKIREIKYLAVGIDEHSDPQPTKSIIITNK